MRLLRFIAAACVALAALPLARADEFDDLTREYREAQQKWFEAYRAAQKEQGEDKPVDFKKLPPRPEAEFFPKFKELAKSQAGKPAGAKALAWVAAMAGRDAEAKADGRWAVEELTEHYAGEAAIADALLQVRYAAYGGDAERLVKLYEKVLETNKDENARAEAKFNLAWTLSECMHDASKSEKEAAKKRSGELFREMAREFPKHDRAKEAEGFIFELDNLQIGMKAPEISGEDADGKTIRLSDFKGKVVVIDFWGFW